METWMRDDDDELTDDDLAFLSQWEEAGKNAEEHEQNILSEVEGTGHAEIEAEEDDPHTTEGDIEESDEDSESDGGGSTEGDEIDESKMDISNVEGEKDISDPRSGEEGDEELGDYSDAEDDELDFEDDKSDSELSDEAEDRDQLTGGDTDSDIPEGEDDLEYDPLEDHHADDDNEDGNDAQAEEEFGDGERANTDEEIEDLDKYEQEHEEHQGEPDSSDDEGIDELEHEQELNAEGEEDFEGDAQAELEDHLKNNQNDSEPELKDNSEREPLTEEPGENQEGDEDQYSGEFENLPEAGDLCTNHCEDNAPEDSLEESCPHCTERIRKERDLHGAIATDMNGNDVLPGDKLHVKIPIAMTAKGAIITANVPNTEIEPNRLAENSRGKTDIERCWLSGKGISNFTGWHMTGVKGQAIWTFKKGQEITFAEKIAQPLFDSDNPEDIMNKLKDDLDQLPETEEPDGGSSGEPEATPEEVEKTEDSSENEAEDAGDESDNSDSGRDDEDGDSDNDESNDSDGSSGEPESEIEIEDITPELLAELSKLNAMAKVFDLENASNYLTDLLKAMGEGA